MALEQDFTSDDHLFLGCDYRLEFPIYTDDAQTTIVDVSSWAFSFTVRRKDNSADPPVIEKSSETSPAGIAVEGVFNSDPDVNTQVVAVTIKDTDTYDPAASPAVAVAKGKYRYALKRTDDGSETILAFGDFRLLQATAR